MKVELLSPAGSFEALQAAVYAGADAIYLGGSQFNARAYASNFSYEELKEAVAFCHLHQVKVHVTVNILFKDVELESLFNYIKTLYELGVDALIVQDEGVMNFILTHFKDIEVHASTQCTIHHPLGLKHYQKLGVSRVVVSRENSIDDIKTMVASGLEVEAFIHGALCVSYSGQCHMSYAIGQRSANRGTCAQPCRLPYQIYQNNKKINTDPYLLSTKDLCTIDHLQDLINAGVASFKIEGRMKRPEYVYAMTRAYREVIDGLDSKTFTIDELKQIFNREYTKGYMFYEKMITSTDYSGNKGVPCAVVLSYNQKNKMLSLKAMNVISQNDGIRFGHFDEGKVLNKIYLKGKLVNHVENGEVFEIDSLKKYQKDTLIYKTTDYQLTQRIHQLALKPYRKFPIQMHMIGRVGETATLMVSDGTYTIIQKTTQAIEKADKAMDIERIKAQLSKVGNTIYIVDTIQLELDEDCFFPISILNQLRRDALDALDEKRKHCVQRKALANMPFKKQLSNTTKPKYQNYYHFHNKEQYLAAKPYMSDQDAYFIDLCDDFEILHQADSNLGLVVPSIINDEIILEIQSYLKQDSALKLALNNQNSYEAFKDSAYLLLPGFNICNALTANLYDIPCVASLELTKQEYQSLAHYTNHLVHFTYGHLDNMTTKYCPLSYSQYKQKIEGCKQCLKGPAYLVDRAKASFPMIFDRGCITRILSHKPIHTSPYSNNYIRFTCEDSQSVKAYFTIKQI